MDKVLVNSKKLDSVKYLKRAQYKSKRYYGTPIFRKSRYSPKLRIDKLVNVKNIEYVNLTGKEKKGIEFNSVNEIASGIKIKQLIAACEEHNIFGGSGNGYSTAKKLRTIKDSSPILIINATECDPGLVHDAWLYRNQLDFVDIGCRILDEAFHFRYKLLATMEPLKNSGRYFEQIRVDMRYPIGFEKNLVKVMLDVDIPEKKYASDMGFLVLNIQTVIEIAKMYMGIDSIDERFITVADLKSGKSYAVLAKKGMKVSDVYDKVFKDKKDENTKLYTGKGIMTCHEVKEGEKVSEITSIIFTSEVETDYSKSTACKNCGKCKRVCPKGIKVNKIAQYMEKNVEPDASKCKKYHPEQCIGCGACSFICEAGKDLRAEVAWAKENI